MNTIVVGVDDSEGAKAALRFALEEAELRRAKLRAVHAWQFGYVGVPGLQGSAVEAGLSDLHEAAESALDATLLDAIPDTGEVEVERRVVEGRPGAVLVEESRGADLVVVVRAASAASRGSCSARSASSAPTTPPARW
jgi:nucleotide-binding universal stress UspA family protein